MIYKGRLNHQIITGDLVYHVLYGSDWRALFLKYGDLEKNGLSSGRQMCLVHLQPGTEYQFQFKKSLTKYRITDSMGYVSLNWLRVLELK